MSNASSALPSVFRSPVSFAPASAGRSRSSGRHGGQQTTTRARRNIPELTKARLKEYYSTNTKPTMAEREQIAHELGMNQRSVTIWFQNQRATAKKNQLAMEKGALEAMAAVAAAVSKEKDLVESPELVSPTEAAKGSASADDVLIESTAASSIPSLQSLDSDEHESVGERCAVDEPVVTSKRGSISMDGPDCLVEGGACGGAAVKMRKSSVTLNGMTLASPKQAVLSPPVMLKRPITASFSGASSSALQSPSTESPAGHKQPSQQQMLLPGMTPRPPSLLMSMYGAMPRPIGPEAFAQLLSSPLSPNPAPLATIPDEVPASGMSQGPRLCLESSYERLLQDNVTSAHPPQSAISAEPHLDIGGDLVRISASNAKNPLLTHVPFSSGGSTNVLELQRSLLQLQQQRQQQQLRVITNTVPSGSSSSTEASTQSSPLSADSLPTSASTAGALINSHPSLLYNIASLSTSVPPSGLSISSLASAAASQPMAINLSAFASAAAATAAAAAAGTQVPSVMSLSMPLGSATESVDSSIIRSLYLTTAATIASSSAVQYFTSAATSTDEFPIYKSNAYTI
ncbi:hypothetical protein GQ42DRAFT_158973 [Ramicandelaber brevisporus]|nr:hypothetical protein GQ42DRAFT_158973 [Ramicandelaber brevisporus]